MTDKMNPEMSPDTKKTGVRRVNNMPMYIVGAVVAGFLMMMMVVGIDRANKQNAAPELNEMHAEDIAPMRSYAATLMADIGDGLVLEPAAPPAMIDAQQTPVIIERPSDVLAPPVPVFNPTERMPIAPARDPLDDRIYEKKIALFDEAIKAKTNISNTTGRPQAAQTPSLLSPQGQRNQQQSMLNELAALRQRAGGSGANLDPTEMYRQQLEFAQGLIKSGQLGSGATSPTPTMSLSSAGINTASDNGAKWTLNNQVEPAQPYMLRTGFVIPATLISGINSDLPGQIIAQVSQNVYDTATGRYLLIPLGTRLIGSYSSDVAYGQKRVLVTWNRLIFPRGEALDIGSMPGSDSGGMAGFKDKVNNHYLRTFGSALLMSGVVAGISLTQDDSGSESDRQRASDELSRALGQQIGQTAMLMLQKNMNIAPTLEIRPGYRLNVMVIKDVTLPGPYN